MTVTSLPRRPTMSMGAIDGGRPHHCQFSSVGFDAQTVICQTPAVGNVDSHRFPTRFLPTLIHHLARPPSREQDALTTVTRTPIPWAWVICDALIGRLLTAPQDLATSEAGSWSLVIESSEVVDVLIVLVLI